AVEEDGAARTGRRGRDQGAGVHEYARVGVACVAAGALKGDATAAVGDECAADGDAAEVAGRCPRGVGLEVNVAAAHRDAVAAVDGNALPSGQGDVAGRARGGVEVGVHVDGVGRHGDGAGVGAGVAQGEVGIEYDGAGRGAGGVERQGGVEAGVEL